LDFSEVDGTDRAPLRPMLDLPAMRPAGLPAPRNGVPDDLQRIRGVGRRNEQLLNSLGIFHFGQIAAWTPAEARWVAAFLAFPERIERDDWIGQATILASGGKTGYVKSRRKEAEEEP
jgi:predicted flap endonuclease-1-like 5' DNA nuclease